MLQSLCAVPVEVFPLAVQQTNYQDYRGKQYEDRVFTAFFVKHIVKRIMKQNHDSGKAYRIHRRKIALCIDWRRFRDQKQIKKGTFGNFYGQNEENILIFYEKYVMIDLLKEI